MSARRDVAFVMAEHRLSERQACKLLEVDRSSYRYEPRPDRNAELRRSVVSTGKAEAALRLPAVVGAADAPGLGGEREADLPAVPRGRADGAAAEAETRDRDRHR